jgi:PadR family transcriptional regulator, regulatory protein PadR
VYPRFLGVRLFCRRTPDALQGTLDLLVLRVLSRGPHHGYGIAADIEAIFGDLLRVEEGTLYPPLHRMEHLGWIGAACLMTANNDARPSTD